MSTHRITPEAGWRRPNKGPDGRPLCRRCGEPVPKGRRAWCGPGCVHQHRLRSDPSYVRHCVEQRDHGVCALCGINGERITEGIGPRLPDDWWRRAHTLRGDTKLPGRERLRGPSYDEMFTYWAGMGLDPLPDGRFNAWDADHIVPVVEGGGECGLDGYRTLCWWCHKRETAALRRRLAAAKQPAPEPPEDPRQQLLPGIQESQGAA